MQNRAASTLVRQMCLTSDTWMGLGGANKMVMKTYSRFRGAITHHHLLGALGASCCGDGLHVVVIHVIGHWHCMLAHDGVFRRGRELLGHRGHSCQGIFIIGDVLNFGFGGAGSLNFRELMFTVGGLNVVSEMS